MSDGQVNGQVAGWCPGICRVCGQKGRRLYSGLTDTLFGVSGQWGYLCCDRCNLAWLDPWPTSEEVGRFYDHYYTHVPRARGRLAGLRDAVSAEVLARCYGYQRSDFGQASSLGARALGRLPFVRSVVGMKRMSTRSRTRG